MNRAASAPGPSGSSAFKAEGALPLIRDILDFTPLFFRKTYAAGYLNMVRTTPELWGYFYSLTDRKSQSPLQTRIRITLNKVNTRAFERFYRRTQPEAVVCTHFLPLEVVGRLNKKQIATKVPLFGVVTDFAAHSLWSCPNVDGYFVGSAEAQRQLIRHGHPADRIKETGIPVDSQFSTHATADTKLRLGWNPDLPAILVLCGGFGIGPLLNILNAFRLEPIRAQIIVVTGQNRRLRSKGEQAARLVEPADASAKTRLILENPALFSALSEVAVRLARPQAAQNIARASLNLLHNSNLALILLLQSFD